MTITSGEAGCTVARSLSPSRRAQTHNCNAICRDLRVDPYCHLESCNSRALLSGYKNSYIILAADPSSEGHQAMRRRETAIAVIVAAAFLSLMLLMDKSILNSFIKNTVGEDAFRTIIQFSFVTLLGGAIFLYFNIIKEENEKREKMM
ncbi:hypothetical protein, partial [Methylobacterium frigidaeris]|uniref:hypothetical protein n=1 Tax=Methylobacterium frigidaeris TaxID=2038277 RepID=UPI001A9C6783